GDVKFGDFNNDGNVDIIGLHNAANTVGVQLSLLETVSAVSDVHVRDAESIQDLLGVLDTALDELVSRRSEIGAFQNRLESAKNVALITQENFEAARSQIEDADMAAETAELAKWQVLQQASLSVLTQANVQIQVVLELLS
ncbi:MAG: flagellin, partial [Candidatus Aenigmarchaeota archaeon]|nr:flagellin [Candidatus Aenigmarchaeota archaeon]